MVMLLLSCPALSDIFQSQGFALDGLNDVTLQGDGQGTAGNSNLLSIDNNQVAQNAAGNVLVVQTEDALLFQGAAVAGMGGVFSVNQDGAGAGWQAQMQDGLGLGAQNQDLAGVLDQDLVAVGGGSGVAVGVQALVGTQVQLIITPFGMSGSAQTVGVLDVGALLGGPGGGGFGYGGAIDVGVGQAQQ